MLETHRQRRSLCQALEALAEDRRHGVAFMPNWREETFCSYGSLYDKALAMLGGLQDHGVRPGNEVVFQLADEDQFISLFWGCLLGGVVPVPVTLGYHEEFRFKLYKILHQLESPFLAIAREDLWALKKFSHDHGLAETFDVMEPRALIIEELAAWGRAGETAAAKPEQLAFIQYSSGSTGDPKGVTLTHANLLANIGAIIEGARLTSRDKTLSWMPLTHDMGLIGFHITPLAAGVDQCLMPPSRFLRNSVGWMEKAFENRVTILSSPNFGYRHFLQYFKRAPERDWDLSRIRLIFNGAEPISAELAREFTRALAPFGMKRTAMFPVFGMAEASLAVTFPPVDEPLRTVTLDKKLADSTAATNLEQGKVRVGASFVDLGSPVPGCHMRISNDDGAQMDENVIGHIEIRGVNVTSGYYRNPEASREAFTADGWLRTGDLGFIRKGRLIVTGRTKDVIFKHGVNYFSHDLERVCEEVDCIDHGKTMVCGVFNPERTRNMVIAFIQYRGSLEKFVPIALRLKKYVGKHMGLELDAEIPVAKLPRTTSGKLKRYALAERYESGFYADVQRKTKRLLDAEERKRRVVQLKTPTQERLAVLWREILGNLSINPDDNFFELGGDSLKAGSLAVKIGQTYRAKISLKEIFDCQTLAGMAEQIDRAQELRLPIITAAQVQKSYPLTSEQRRLFFLYQLNKSSLAYNLYIALDIEGPLDLDTLEHAFHELTNRHESLRTAFETNRGAVSQMVCQIPKAAIHRVNTCPERLAETLAALPRPFDLVAPPLIRLYAAILRSDCHTILIEAHHIACDGVSLSILCDELFRLYKGETLPPQPLQFHDYAVWQHKRLTDPLVQSQGNYWRKQLSGDLPILQITTDYPRPAMRDEHGDRVRFIFNRELTHGLKELAHRRQTTLSMVALALFKAMLACYCGQRDLIVGSALSGRNHPGIESIVGMFVKTVALRARFDRSMTFLDLLDQVKNRFFEAYANQDYPFERIVEETSHSRDLSRTPLVEALFVSQNFDIPELEAPGLTIQEKTFYHGYANFDLVLEIRERGSELHGAIEYGSSLFRRKTVIRMTRRYRHLAKQAVENPEILFKNMLLASPNELRQIVQKFNASEVEIPAQTMAQILAERTLRFHDRDALIHDARRMTYGELDRLAVALAAQLQQRGVGPETVVGLMTRPGFEMIIGVWAILKAGGAFLPIDNDNPDPRKVFMLEDCDAGLLLAERGLEDVTGRRGEALWFDCDALANAPATRFTPPTVAPANLAYVIFTSGSTGNPKGVSAPHHGLVNFLKCIQTHFPTKPDDLWMCKTTYTFDASMHDLFLWAIGGGKAYLAPRNLDLEPNRLFRALRDNRATHTIFAASVMQYWFEHMQDNDFHQLRSLKYIFVGGEPLPANLSNRTLEMLPSTALINCYGPTETTVTASLEETGPREIGGRPTIGRPIQNMRLFIFSAYGQLQPVGVPGEICIAGKGETRGYCQNPRLTANKFTPHPFGNGERVYRSGDLGRWLQDGRVEFLGRLDHQLKIRGFRIELGEIEAILRRHPHIQQAVAAGKPAADGGLVLCAYFVPSQPVEPVQLREFAEQWLPDYMTPAFFIELEAIPMTPSGKLDASRLPHPAEAETIYAAYAPPANQIEEAIIEAWRETLGIDRIGAHDHFFALGGHSLLAAKAVEAIRKKTGVQIEVRVIFEAPKVRELARRIAQKSALQSGSRQKKSLARLREALQAKLKWNRFKTGDQTFSALFTDIDPETLARQPSFRDLNPHYVRPLHVADHLPDQQSLDWTYGKFADFMGLTHAAHLGSRIQWRRRLGKARRQFAELLARQPVTAEFPAGHHPSWFVKRGLRSTLFAQFHCALGAERGLFLESVNRFIAKQSLMHSVILADAQDQCIFREYEPAALADLPFFDLSGCRRAAQASAIARLRRAMSEDLRSQSPQETPLFNLALIRLNDAEHLLIFAFDHIIADHDCVRVVQYHFRPLNDPQMVRDLADAFDYPVESYRAFTELSRPDPADSSIARFKDMSEYQRYRDLSLTLQERLGSSGAIVFSRPYLLTLSLQGKAGIDGAFNFMGLGLAIAAQAIAILFQLRETPLRVLANRRIFAGLNFFNTIGDFHDSVPVVFPGSNLTPETAYQKLRAFDRRLSDAGLYVSNYGGDPEIKRAIFKSPFNFNYVGELAPEEEKATLAKAGPLEFVAYPVFAYRAGAALKLLFLHGFDDTALESLQGFLEGIVARCQIRRL